MRPARLSSAQLPIRGAILPRSFTSTRQASPILRSFFTSTQTFARTQAPLQISRSRQSLVSRGFRALRYNSNKSAPRQKPDPTPHLGSPEPALSLSQRLKKLSREYGWAAVGVYFALSVLDFPFFFLAVRYIGAEKIGQYEHVVVEAVKSVLRVPFPGIGEAKDPGQSSASREVAEATAREGDWTDQLEQAEAQNSGAGACMRPFCSKS